ncbi:MAG TPA: aspartate aminotransferase family protein [Solirubrobacterales bacterium]|jgi:glutamate-1-semialdehyde 2,1-aminomutase|nr:aspartate aminotransferase family protein [Solirubrobacterales bacterium]
MTVATIDRKRIAELTEAEQERYRNRTGTSARTYERAVKSMPNGVPSSFQSNEPWPVYIDRGEGSRVWDVDGNEYVDFHNGFGVMCIGHANPTVGEAVKAQVDRGTHFAAPTDGSIVVAEELQRRFGLPQWRFTNSGTESTMDAVHLVRGVTGRDMLLKIEGSYHGHHDAVMVSVYPPLEALGDRDDPVSVPYGAGMPRALTDLTRSVPFNDAEALAAVLDKIGDQVAGLIMEPAMMNINIVPPREGYLARVRELTAEHGVKLIFDEVKTGCTIAAGGAIERFGVTPDIVTLAKATCGGYPGGSIGMTDELAALVADGTVNQYGTFNGNPLVMAAAEATLTEVLTDDVYAHLEETNRRLLDACQEIIDSHGLPAYTEGLGAKGCVIFSSERMYEYRDYLTKVDDELSTLAWLYHMNHGVFMTPGVEEEWTLSIAHTEDDLQTYVDAFEAFARDVAGG